MLPFSKTYVAPTKLKRYVCHYRVGPTRQALVAVFMVRVYS